jgi:hypothetical protein
MHKHGRCYFPQSYSIPMIPHYTTSLDAIQAAAKKRFKTSDEILNFDDALDIQSGVHRKQWQLTAADWCEAYLRCVSKWEAAP